MINVIIETRAYSPEQTSRPVYLGIVCYWKYSSVMKQFPKRQWIDRVIMILVRDKEPPFRGTR